ncbi:DUF5017 domain-containing protein [Pseudoflavitalea rhizosphaerae]|uniref:DUF5017 domain-containing protein n=1 Tax=Pseudoflavitalea rhizosphaerae TaxID=1884793 RepID=UPI0013E02A84|nr:DUF5017 domain-containing protein [Pseudoflavitalea rhizosphaerae]
MKFTITYIVLLTLLITSCAKVKTPEPNLSITTSSNTYKAGDTVTFNFAGNPDNIIFYSGEIGHNYEYRKRTKAPNDLQIQFKSFVSFGVIAQNLQLMVSNNFNGIADQENLEKATWTDISHLATWSAGADQVNSGVISLKPYEGNDENSVMHVAFRYTDTQKTEGQNRWVIRTFSADNVTPEGSSTNLAVMSTAGWKAVSIKNPATVWTITSAQLLMYGGNATQPDNEDWVITKAFDSKTVQPDAGIALKNISKTLDSYKYVFNTPGTYRVVFETSAVRYNGENRKVNELTLTITP